MGTGARGQEHFCFCQSKVEVPGARVAIKCSHGNFSLPPVSAGGWEDSCLGQDKFGVQITGTSRPRGPGPAELTT
jgi:hypothetical protein